MNEGERQVAPTLDGIRRDHVARYEWAAKRIPACSRVIDFACGVGYGTKILAEAGHIATGSDRDREALAYAREHYAHERARFHRENGDKPWAFTEADAAVCFETLEHIEDPRPLLKALHASAPLLIASVPNEAVFPFNQPGGMTIAYHFRHYLKNEFAALLQACGWCPVEWYGQADHAAEVEPEVNGRTLIVVAQRDVMPEEKPEGKHIAILGLGGSITEYLEITKRKGGRSAFCDEVWAINALGNVFDCDLVFHMDDVRIQEIRAAANPAGNIAAMLEWLRTSPVPIVSSRAHPGYPAVVEYPLEDVLNDLGHDYFNSTTAYAVALAIHIRAAKISLFGLDFTYENQHHAEKGRACVEFWLGFARARGIKLLMPKTTTLMDACHTRAERLYGYDAVDVEFDIKETGQVKLKFTEKETLPSAAALEARYDHSAPIAEQHLTAKEPT